MFLAPYRLAACAIVVVGTVVSLVMIIRIWRSLDPDASIPMGGVETEGFTWSWKRNLGLGFSMVMTLLAGAFVVGFALCWPNAGHAAVFGGLLGALMPVSTWSWLDRVAEHRRVRGMVRRTGFDR